MSEKYIEKVDHEGVLLAIIIRDDFKKDGVHFFTPNEFSQQLAYMRHKKGHVIRPHVHNTVHREVTQTQEVLVIKKGKLRVDFFDGDQNYLESRCLTDGDVILLSGGGHGFCVEEDLEMLEVKQGPYAGNQDKTLFDSIDSSKVKLVE